MFFHVWRCIYIANQRNEQPINDKIRVSELMVIGPKGEQMGIKKLEDALVLAEYAGLDLVLINDKSTPAIGKVMDYNKYRYERQKKQKEASKRQRETNKDLKEYRFSITIDIGDFNTKKNNATEYLKKGHKVRATVRFKGRQIAHPEKGKAVLDKFAEELSDIADIETKVKLEGRNMFVILAPKK